MISKTLIQTTLNYFEKFRNNNVVVSPSLPILYFGDLVAYEKSELKIVTVGKNPSDNEFRLKKEDNFSFVRFPKWDEETKKLITALNPYFEEKPLQWFSCFEPILNGLSASYYQKEEKGKQNIALHTDICSPLATNPTWSKLPKEIQKTLFEDGVKIWKELMEELKPDIMLVSIPKSIFKSICTTTSKELITFRDDKNGKPRKPYLVEECEYKLDNNKKVKVIFGQAANTPFGTISTEQKNEIGKLCLKQR